MVLIPFSYKKKRDPSVVLTICVGTLPVMLFQHKTVHKYLSFMILCDLVSSSKNTSSVCTDEHKTKDWA